MDALRNRRSTFAVTGIFGNSRDAEIAYQLLMELGYSPGEVTVIMSDETMENFCRKRISFSSLSLGSEFRSAVSRRSRNIANAIAEHGKFVAMPGASFVVAGDFDEGCLRALTNSVFSDKYADFYQTAIKRGEIVIDFTPHSAREKNIVMNSWEDFGGHPIIRKADRAA